MQEKENQATRAKGALVGAKMNVASLNAEAEYELNHELIDDFSKRPDDLAGIGAGLGTAMAGAVIGSIIPGIGTLVGGIIGGIAGAIGGIFTG
jgi:hypothetical protein